MSQSHRQSVTLITGKQSDQARGTPILILQRHGSQNGDTFKNSVFVDAKI
ncbi:MAG: hypothetical protein AAGA18_08960 [Verrucomicrobiota bacterium]